MDELEDSFASMTAAFRDLEAAIEASCDALRQTVNDVRGMPAERRAMIADIVPALESLIRRMSTYCSVAKKLCEVASDGSG